MPYTSNTDFGRTRDMIDDSLDDMRKYTQIVIHGRHHGSTEIMKSPIIYPSELFLNSVLSATETRDRGLLRGREDKAVLIRA